MTAGPVQPASTRRGPGLGLVFGILTLVLLVAIIGAAVAWFAGTREWPTARAVERVRAIDSPLVEDVSFYADWFDGDVLVVTIKDPASDAEARSVWCSVVGPSEIPDDAQVQVLNEHVWWDRPTDCSDPADVPAGVVQSEFQDLPGGPYSSPAPDAGN